MADFPDVVYLESLPDSSLFEEQPSIFPLLDQVRTVYRMQAWHLSLEKWIPWKAYTTPDPNGTSYPGPGTFGVDTTSPAHIVAVTEE